MVPVRSALAALALLAVPLTAPAAQSLSDAQRRDVETIVRDYIMKNPEVIIEAVEQLRNREKVEAEERAKKALVANRSRIFEDPTSPVVGNPKGDVTVVEFFDYSCGYCKAVQADVSRLVKDDRNLRLVFKEFPILGPGSVVASKAALAARMQGKYAEMHDALMEHRGQFDEATVLRYARSVGADPDRLKKDMESPEVKAILEANHALAEELNIRGTPGFIFGDELVPGAIKYEEMKRLVAAVRKG